jgi:hypothetical protein
MAESFSIDLDAEKVLLDGAWFGKDDLVQRIKTMVEGGDYKLSRPSAALEALESALGDLTSVTIRLPRGALNALSGAAIRSGKSVEALARELIGRAIATPTASVSSSMPAAQAPTPAPMPLQLTATVKGHGTDPALPIQLTPKKGTDPAPQGSPADGDPNWFGRR